MAEQVVVRVRNPKRTRNYDTARRTERGRTPRIEYTTIYYITKPNVGRVPHYL